MAENTQKRSFKQLEQQLTIAVIVNAAIYLLYLLFAGFGITWLKVILALAGISLGILGCAFLVLIGEHKRRRSLWILCAFGSIAACILVSLLTRFPGSV